MSDDGIWLVGGDGGLVPMEPSKPASEDDLQSLIARHCEVIAGDGEKLLLVRREQGIADSEEGSERLVTTRLQTLLGERRQHHLQHNALRPGDGFGDGGVVRHRGTQDRGFHPRIVTGEDRDLGERLPGSALSPGAD